MPRRVHLRAVAIAAPDIVRAVRFIAVPLLAVALAMLVGAMSALAAGTDLPEGDPAAGSDPQACASSPARPPYDERVFLGYACRDDDCAAHKAGFAWADLNGLEDAQACTGTDDPAFEEGCRAFVADAVTAEQAGFEWARENEVADPCLCEGAGPRFGAGCEAFVVGFSR